MTRLSFPLQWTFSLVAMAVGLIAQVANAGLIDDNDDRDKQLITAFLAHVEASEISSGDKQKIRSLVEGQSVAAISEGLGSMYPDFSKAVEAAAEEEVTPAVEALTPHSNSSDKFLAAEASFYLARVLMNNERFEQAMPLMERLTGELADFSIHAGEVQYFSGVAHAGMLKRDLAIEAFTDFLQENPDAAERLRVSAWRQVQELQAVQAGQLSDVHQHMDFSRRRLDQKDTGEETQEKQGQIVKMLNKLIKEEEKKECNSSCKNSSKKNPQKSEKPEAPKQDKQSKPSESKEGGSSSNANGDVTDKSYDDSPASPWSRLRDRSRDPANNAIKEKLPARYRDIVEKYYEAANGNAEEADKKK